MGSLPEGRLGCPRTLPSHSPLMTRDMEAQSKKGPCPTQGLSAERELPAPLRAALRNGCPSEWAGGWGYAQSCLASQNHMASRCQLHCSRSWLSTPKAA